MKNSSRSKDNVVGCVGARLSYNDKAGSLGKYSVVYRDPQGKVQWVEAGSNLTVNSGLDLTLESTLGGGTNVTSWFFALKGPGVPVASDTMASHPSWAEDVTYSDATRIPAVFGATVAQVIDNFASPAVFNINGATTVHGVILTSSNVKGGVVGTLYSVKDFATPHVLLNGSTLTVTYDATQSSL